MANVATSRITRSIVALGAALAAVVALAAPASADPLTPQTITFDQTFDATVGDAPILLTATSDSGLPVQYTTDSTVPGGIDSDVNEPVCGLQPDGTDPTMVDVVIAHAGSCVINADQDGTDANGQPTSYAPAAQVSRTVTIAKAAQSFAPLTAPTGAAVGLNDVITATPSSGLPVTYSVTADSVTAGGDPVCSFTENRIYYLHVGTCTVQADQAGNNDYAAATPATAPITVGQGTQTLTLDLPAGQVGDTNALAPTTTAPGLTVALDVDSSTDGYNTDNQACSLNAGVLSYDHHGSCVVDASQGGSDDYESADLQRSVTVGQLTQDLTLDVPTGAVGDTKTVTASSTSTLDVATSVDANLTTTINGNPVCTLAGDQVSYLHHGTCVIDAEQDGTDNNGHDDYVGADTQQSVTIGRLGQQISLSVATGSVGDTHPVTASATSGLDVVVSVDPNLTTTINGNPVCTLTGDQLSYLHHGTCVIDAEQDGADTNGYDDYAHVDTQQSITIAQLSQQISLAVAAGKVGDTHPVTASATSSLAVAVSVDQTLTDKVDGELVCSLSGGQLAYVHHGTCVIDAEQDGIDNNGFSDYADVDKQQRVTVAQAATSSAVSLHQAASATKPTITVHVIAPSPAPTVDSGRVTITVDGRTAGTPTVTNGVATLAYPMPTGASHVVQATYSGQGGDFANAARVQVNRTDPRLAAHLASAKPKSKYGWYHTPVAASFTCAAGTGHVGACPAKVSFSANAKGQHLTRTIKADDGGAATAALSRINVDTTKPRVIVAGVTNGNSYLGNAPSARCLGSDALSGLASCRLKRTTHANGVVAFTATATDKAGNSATTSGTYRVVRNYVLEAIYDASSGAYLIQTGTPYTVVALANHQPRYYQPVHFGTKPTKAGVKLARDGSQAHLERWTTTVTFAKSMRSHRYWSIGLRINGVMNLVKLRIVG